MAVTISLTPEAIDTLDLTPALVQIDPWLTSAKILDYEQQIQFEIDYPRPREQPDLELSQIAPVRLWFIRLDTVYPWLPFLLDWRSGELVRYAAMLVPHEFHPRQGIQYNPQALDMFVMAKVFILWKWLSEQGVPAAGKIKAMAEMFGYELDMGLFKLLQHSP
ncbi:CRR6 family NdhI maturation factor [Candidatus Synechococcus calcipolaris G9]|uniref:CRR6 family NdhI maturation factor n=1 Tax=Candidatus Synechococcus calcipolaris G9 TaxID=1497997 RepID=A0ABT6F168_9SYNE|nr:CRR6 family NdhI maturation factor [Candidatus Synechococcus calcipolaris]MDG2991594.1 CRR6 family NdhI maturation factor [Candidatus Synechococcus calcipolaris G9]